MVFSIYLPYYPNPLLYRSIILKVNNFLWILYHRVVRYNIKSKKVNEKRFHGEFMEKIEKLFNAFITMESY